MKKKKVLVWETLATVSGGQKMTLTIMDMLSEQYEFYCLIPEKGLLSDELDRRNISYVLMGDQSLPAGVKGKKVIFRYGWMSLKNIWKSISVIRNYRPDILYAPGPAALPWSAICGSLTHKPVIWHLHHNFLDGATKKLLNICSSWKSVKSIIAVSNCVGTQIESAKSVNKINVIYNPVDLKKYASGNASKVKHEIAEKLKYSSESNSEIRIVLGQVALIQEAKKQWFTIDLIKELRNRGYDAVGIFAGECRKSKYMEELYEKAEKCGIKHQVAFLGRRNDIPDLLKIMDALIIPSVEGFPLAGLEAAAAGVPVIACNVAGAKEFICVSGDGSCYMEDDLEDAVRATEDILKNRDEMIKNGKVLAEKMTNLDYMENIKKVFAQSI